jgi:biopolymer transport protein ExbD
MTRKALYFVDVLACLLFGLTLVLVSARSSRETTVPVELPRLASRASPGSDLESTTITLRSDRDALQIFLDAESVSFDELEQRLRGAPPASVRVRAESSALSRVIGIAHAAGIADIQLAYETDPRPTRDPADDPDDPGGGRS